VAGIARRTTGENRVVTMCPRLAVSPVMRRISLALLVLVACADHGSNAPPAECRCVSDTPVANFSDCCGSTTCYYNDDQAEWEIHACDPPLADPCDSCRSDELCVERFDGTCHKSSSCEPITVSCPDNACSAACEDAYCGGAPFQCELRSPCGTERPGSFTCYGS
jgi:hypothetical protein